MKLVVIKTNSAGGVDTFVSLYDNPPTNFYQPYAHIVDPTRGYMIYQERDLPNLITMPFDANYYPDTFAADTIPTSGVNNCMFMNPYTNRLYAGSATIDVYSVNLTALTPININNGETVTTSRTIKLKLQAMNCQWIYVKSDGLSSISAPVNTLDKWVYVGADWTNDAGVTRATTLEVDAVLSSGFDKKTITVYYLESSAGYYGVNSTLHSSISYMYKREITLVDTSVSIDSISPERIQYGGIKIKYVVRDAYDRTSDISAMYSLNNGDYKDMTIASGGESLSDVTTSFVGTEHYFYWDYDKDLFVQTGKVTIRIKADNGTLDGQWKYTSEFIIPDKITGLTAVDASKRLADGTWRYGVVLRWDYTTSGYRFEIQKKEGNGEWAYIGDVADTYYDLQNLSDTIMYFFRTRARDNNGFSSDFSDSVFIILSRTKYEEKTVDEKGGEVEIEDYDGVAENNAKVIVPEGAVSGKVKLGLVRYSDEIYEISVNDAMTGKEIKGYGMKKPVEIRLPYDVYEVKRRNWDENKLSIFYFDEIRWIQLGSNVNTAYKYVSTKVNHFTKFRIMEASVKESNISVVPEVFTPNSDGINDRVRFNFPQKDMLEDNAVIEIYDMTGKLVAKLPVGGSYSVEWNGMDESGVLQESGIYVYRIKGRDRTYTGTVTIAK